jgi:hypothetical protein
VENARQRAWVYAQDPGEGAGGDPGPTAEDAEGHPLRACESDGGLHPFRERLEAVVESPDEAHEVEDLAEVYHLSARRLHTVDDLTTLI